MASLALGLLAALTWGLHDFLLRGVSQRAPALPLFAIALIAGSVALFPLTFLAGGWSGIDGTTTGYALVSGLAYGIGGLGLYRAFAIGPVRIVAPVCGSYPVLSLGLAAFEGRIPGVIEALAVIAVIAGIAIVAQGEHDKAAGSRAEAIGWAVLAAAGFALTFHLGQIAAASGAELPATLIARLAALAAILLAMAQARQGLGPALPFWRIMILLGCLDVAALAAVLMAGGFANPEYAAVASSTFGIVTIILAWRFLREPMRPLQWAGVAIVFGGIAALAGR